jgi:hypothetical protein
MATRATFEVVTKGFEDALVKYKVAVQKGWAKVVRQQARLVAEKVMKVTPPVKRGGGMSEKKKGEAAVTRDVNKVFADLGGTKWENESLDKMWRAGNFEGVKAALENSPNYHDMPIAKYERVFPYPIKNIHQSARGNKPRSVPKNWTTRYAVGAKGTEKKYIRDVQSHVGKSKSGWLAAIVKLGGRAPAWVSRHGTSRGSVSDKAGNPDNPIIEMENDAINVNSQFAIKGVLKYQTKVLLREAARIMAGGKFRFKG